jgi:hypothetical protein
MSQVLIQQYLNQLQDLRKVSGTHRESVVREAFKDLLKGWARSRDLIFVREKKASEAGFPSKCILKADKDGGRIIIDSETTLTGVPPEAWDYRLGNRSALEWILDQYKEKKPKDPTIREKFNTYRLEDYKEKVIDLLMRVTTVSVQTTAIIKSMRNAAR